ncbi:hypothetical protein QBK99_00890 [Corticibacterium sp. UT-5YL-CI-8]|nr:hypothetical protein [Tianweitania sp. UT-5YL-CI-8]
MIRQTRRSISCIDNRWGQPEFWLAIADALSPLIDRNLLAAVDLGRNASGDIQHLPAEQSVNGVGYPYAIIAASLTG